jgi:hypothetical protein
VYNLYDCRTMCNVCVDHVDGVIFDNNMAQYIGILSNCYDACAKLISVSTGVIH